MEAFSPVPALIGGLLIGLASAVLWLGNGRIAGISGIFGQLLPPARTVVWRLVFLAALVIATFTTAQLLPGLGPTPQLVTAPPALGISTPIWIAIAGLLIGFGTKIANGCTSGHGICGLARLSKRSAVAVAVFFGVAIVTVAVTGVV